MGAKREQMTCGFCPNLLCLAYFLLGLLALRNSNPCLWSATRWPFWIAELEAIDSTECSPPGFEFRASFEVPRPTRPLSSPAYLAFPVERLLADRVVPARSALFAPASASFRIPM